MCGGGGGDGGAAEEARRQRAEAEQRERERQERIAAGNAAINDTFSKFDDNFYGGRRQAYIDYATPQLQDEYERAAKDLSLALARAGLGQSSEAANRRADLQKRFDLATNTIANTARDYETQARGSLEGARGDLLNLSASAADPTLVAQNAVARANTISQLPAFNPLGSLLGDLTTGLATQAQLERRGLAKYDTGLFNNDPRRAQRIVST